VTERYGLVFLAPETPLVELPPVDSAEDPAFEAVELVPSEARVGAGQSADNFLDFAHFPFLHRATIGTEESTVLDPYTVNRDGLGFTVVYEHPVANRVDPGVAAGIRPLVQTRRMTYWYTAPFFLVLRLEYLETDAVNVIGFFIQPQSDDSCRLYMTLWCNDLGGDPSRREDLIAYEQKILDEDLALQRQFDDLSLPLELSAEIHTRADKNTVELRRVLADLVAQATAATSLDTSATLESLGLETAISEAPARR
jgi:vanillate O-demethylase monooxygenase subunit